MALTTGYQAATETNQVVVSYAVEAQWGVLPAVPFQAVRLTSESLSGTKQRQRPSEIQTTGQVSAAVTTQESAGGGLNFALSFGTYDDLFAGALNSTWQAPVVINGAAGNMAISAGAAGTVRTLTGIAGMFAPVAVGQWIKVFGFTQTTANGLFRVTAKAADGSSVSFMAAGATAAETPAGAAVRVRASTLGNSNQFQSFYMQKQVGPTAFLCYPGTFVSGMTLSGANGQFLNGSFTFMAQSETPAAANASTGAVMPAPTGRVHDPVGGFNGVFLDGLPIAGVVQSFQVSTQATGAGQDYGLGASAAQGMKMGLLEAKGQLKMYFRDFTLYQRFKSEVQGALSFATSDPTGATYIVTLNAANLLDPKVVAGGPSQPVMADFTVEGNPTTAGLPTIQIDRLPAS